MLRRNIKSTGAGVALTSSCHCAMVPALRSNIRDAVRIAQARRGNTVVGVDSIIITLIIGAIAGWLAGQIVRGFGYGLLWNIIIGIIGAYIGVWLLTTLGFVPFSGFVGSIVNALIGAVVLLFIIGFIRR